jgi:hypothetical protein
MSAADSNLSPTSFDYVVAITQDSLNASLKEYLYGGGLPEVTLCYAYNAQGAPEPIDYATFVASASNVDPFSVPDGTAANDQRVQTLNNAGFAFAVRARLGLPPGVAPADVPPIIVLKPGQSSVTYTLTFSDFQATVINYGARGAVLWSNLSQPSGTPWTFSGLVDLDLQDADFTALPADAQSRLKGLGGAAYNPSMFSAQQLYYDLNSAALQQGFEFNGIPSNSVLNAFMTGDFIDTYWKSLGAAEVLGYAAKQVAAPAAGTALAVTDVNFFTPDGAGGGPLTLNYLCATNGNPLPDTTHAGFGWDWITTAEASQFDGVASLNRGTFTSWLTTTRLPDGQTLNDYVASNCYQPTVNVSLSGATPNFTWTLEPGGMPSVTLPPSGPTLASYSYQSAVATDQAGLGGDVGEMQLSSSFTMDVTVSGNQMVIVQHLVVWLLLNKHIVATVSGNIVDKQITDTYSFGIDDTGRIVVSTPSPSATPPSSVTVDASQQPDISGFLDWFVGVNDPLNAIAASVQSCVASNFSDVPVSSVQNFIFPGGATFSFADVSFSSYQDLVPHITYAATS